MAIYNIFDFYEKIQAEKIFDEKAPKIDPSALKTNQLAEDFVVDTSTGKDRLFSSIAARLFFFLLLIADLSWGAYSLVGYLIKLTFSLLTGFQISALSKSLARSYLSVKRAIVCGLALIIALFSPALGMMFASVYFLMYDKTAIDEIVPTSLRDQFKGIFSS